MAQVKTGADAKAAFWVAMVLITIASFVGVPAIGWMVAPFVLLLAFFAIARAALSDTMLVLLFLALVLENPAEMPGGGVYQTPFITFGGLMLTHLKTIIGGPWFFGGMDMCLIAAIIVALVRRGRTSAAERALATPKLMVQLSFVSLAIVPWLFLVGKYHGNANQQMAFWQADRVTYLPILFLLYSAAFKGPTDHIRAGKVILAAGLLRALLSMYVRYTFGPDAGINPETGESLLAYSTTHNDSITFAMTAVLLVALIIQRVSKKTTYFALALAPILVGGMIANSRRMVWVQIILVLATVYLMTESNPFKRKLQRTLWFMSPAFLAYVVVGWGSTASMFKPVQTIKSAVSPETDSSTLWREIENFDLIFTIKQFPIVGAGYGQKFWEIIPLPAVDYVMEYYLPHNSLLGLWCFYGLFGVICVTSLWVGGVYFGIRAYHFSKVPIDKAAAIVSFASVLVYLVQCFGDMGLGCWAGVFTVAPSLAVACKLAISSGAWPAETPKKARRRAPVAAPTPTATAAPRGSA
jgi:hypothetical protein